MIVVTIMIILGFGFLIGSVRSDPLGVSVWWLGVYIGIALLIGASVVTISGVLP